MSAAHTVGEPWRRRGRDKGSNHHDPGPHKSMPEPNGVAWPIDSAEDELRAFQAYRLGPVSHIHTAVRCGPRRGLRRWQSGSKLAAIATQAKVCGVDFSKESVTVAKRTNQKWIDMGRVEIVEGSVSQLPFSANVFDFVTAVETHFWWPDPAGDMHEVLRVLKPGGKLVLIAEIYKGANTTAAKLAEKLHPPGMTLLSVSEHRELFANAGYADVQIIEEPSKGWICGIGVKPVITRLG
jgi:SAM-dependent methyltransferase